MHSSMFTAGNASVLLSTTSPEIQSEKLYGQPNTALLSLILCLGTFWLASSFKSFKNSHFLGKTVSNYILRQVAVLFPFSKGSTVFIFNSDSLIFALHCLTGATHYRRLQHSLGYNHHGGGGYLDKRNLH